jgi:quercetin dioxygenase-like cupin family protein
MAVQQPPGITRIDLQEHDLRAHGREVIQSVVIVSPDALPVGHKHPGGEEIIYVLEGSLEYEVDGQSPTTVNAGEVFFVPADTVHAVRNIGTGDAAELATYVVGKDKPLLVAADAAPSEHTWGDVLVESYLAE